jgi:hypothetical protein
MQGQVRLFPEQLRSLAFGFVGSSYTVIGSALQNPIYILHFVNGTDAAITISWDGVTDHAYLPAGAFLLLDATANHAANVNGLWAGIGQRFWVKEVTAPPTMGVVTLSAYYAA